MPSSKEASKRDSSSPGAALPSIRALFGLGPTGTQLSLLDAGSFGFRIETRCNLDDLGEVNRRQIQIVQVGTRSLERWQCSFHVLNAPFLKLNRCRILVRLPLIRSPTPPKHSDRWASGRRIHRIRALRSLLHQARLNHHLKCYCRRNISNPLTLVHPLSDLTTLCVQSCQIAPRAVVQMDIRLVRFRRLTTEWPKYRLPWIRFTLPPAPIRVIPLTEAASMMFVWLICKRYRLLLLLDHKPTRLH